MLPPKIIGAFIALIGINGGAIAAVEQSPSSHFAHLNQARYGATAVTDGRYIYVVGGAHFANHRIPAERIDTKTGEVEILDWQPLQRRYHAAAIYDGTVWIFGGEEDGEVIGLVEKIDIKSGYQQLGPSWLAPRQGTTAIVSRGGIMLLGGLASRDEQDTRGAMLEILNPTDETYFLGTDLPEPIETKAVEVGGSIYLVGGWEPDAGTSNRVYVMGEDEEWRRLADMPFALSAHAIVSDGEFIYSFGDYEDLDRVARYEIATDKWTLIDVPYTPRRHAAAVMINDQVYVIGGNTASGGPATTVVESYTLNDLREASLR